MTLRRPTASLLVTALAVAGAALPAPAAEAVPGDVRGRVTHVVDGDTIHVRVGSRIEKVRVIGVDTPELARRDCYATQATSATTRLVGGKVVILRADRTQANRDVYGRLLRHVVLTDGTLLSRRLIANGFGREYTYARPYVGQPTNRANQARAIAKRRGMWGACSGSTVAPRVPTTKPTTKKPTRTTGTVGRCTIKGNISTSGERIYHLPGQRHYDVTVITPSKGERWFCSRRDAERAGWRPAKV